MSDDSNYLEVEFDLKVMECHCGSGKRPDQCCGPIKPRTHKVRLDRRNFEESDGLVIGTDYSLKRIVKGQHLSVIGTPIFVQSHSRNGKAPKIIVQGEAGGDWLIDSNSILRRFDEYFVIDTNTRMLHGHQVSMSAVLHARVQGDHLYFAPMTALEFWDPEIGPELLGWYALIQSLEEGGVCANQSIGLIVDAYLDSLGEFNDRKKELYDGLVLPSRMKFIYASADKGIAVANRLMKSADQLATFQLDCVARSVKMNTLKSTPYPCRLFRQWLP